MGTWNKNKSVASTFAVEDAVVFDKSSATRR